MNLILTLINVYASTEYEVLKLFDNSTMIIDYLLKQLIDTIGECDLRQGKIQEIEFRLESLSHTDEIRVRSKDTM